jgi:probable phosphoglycerate mutase
MEAEVRTTLVFVRHGESNVTVRQVVGGELTCDGLSPLGIRQAEALGDRLRHTAELHVDALVTSTLPRAEETAAVIAGALGLAGMEREAELVEHRPGDADGIPFAEFASRFDLFDLRAEPDRPIAPGGESLRAFYVRVEHALRRLERAHRGSTVMVVCHGGVIDVAMRALLGVGLAAPFDLWTFNASLTELRGGPDRWTLLRYNDAAHLHGLPARTEPAARRD